MNDEQFQRHMIEFTTEVKERDLRTDQFREDMVREMGEVKTDVKRINEWNEGQQERINKQGEDIAATKTEIRNLKKQPLSNGPNGNARKTIKAFLWALMAQKPYAAAVVAMWGMLLVTFLYAKSKAWI